MILPEHPTDEVLLEVIADGQGERDQSSLETHLSNCVTCQTRLMSLACGDWLTDYRDCLSADLLSESSHSSAGTHEFAAPLPRVSGSRKENEFESGAIDQMLSKLLAPPTHPEMLGRLGRYEIERIIGAGGMGLVLRGYDRELQRPVAIKMMIPRLANNGTAKQRFTREVRAVAAILHPNVIAIHGVDETKGMPWFVMPFVAGPSLRELVEQKGPLPEREIARIGLQIASGLAAAHGQGVVHRDIKPDNILVDNQINRVVITDFGLARRDSEETITQTGVLAGTLNYMSPEQARGEDVDGRSDLFSLGALLYFLATGSDPFRADTPAAMLHKVANKRPSDVRSLNPELSKTLAGTIGTLLAKKPAHRFQSSVELEGFFERFVSHLNKPTIHRVPGIPNLNHGTTQWVAGALLALTTMVAGLCAYQHFASPSTSTATVESRWAELQSKYRLDAPSQFHKELTDLGVDFGRMESEFERDLNYEHSAFKNEVAHLGKSLETIESAIDVMGQ